MIRDRTDELTALAGLLERTDAGRGGTALIEGRAGVGKTTLLRWVAAAGTARGFQVLGATGGEVVQESSFGVVRDLFHRPLAERIAGDAGDVLAGAAGLSAHALGLRETSPDLPRVLTPDSRARSVQGLTWLAMNLAVRRPLLLLLDDGHLVDRDSAHWLEHLARHLDDTRIAVVVARRPGETGAFPLGEVDMVRLRPQPLGDGAVADWVRDVFPAVSGEAVQTVVEMTDGLPFLVNAVLDGVGEELAPDQAPTPARLRAHATRGVAADVLARLARTGSDATRVAQATALLGPDAESRRLAHLAELSLSRIEEVVDGLVDAGFATHGPPVRLAHPLIAEALLDSLPGGRRSRLHLEAADLLEAEHLPGRAAAHLMLAHPSGEPRRASLLRWTAARDAARGAPSTAATHLRRALAEPPAADEVAGITLELGLAEVQSDDPRALETLARAVEVAAEGEERRRAHVELARALLMSGQIAQLLTIYERLLADLGPDEEELRTDLLAERFAVLSSDVAAAGELDVRERELPPVSSGTPSLPGRRVLADLCHAAMRRVAPRREVVELGRRALGEGTLDPEAVLSSQAFLLCRMALIYADDLDTTEAADATVTAWAHAVGAPGLLLASHITQVLARYRRGELREVERLTLQALAAAQEGLGAPIMAAMVGPVGVHALVDQGRSEEAMALLTGFGMWELPVEALPFSAMSFARAAVREARGDADGALADLLFCGEKLVHHGSLNPAFTPWRSAAARLLAGRDAARAHRLAGEEVELARSFGAARALSIALRSRATVGSTDPEADLAEALDWAIRGPDRLEHARCLVELGALERRQGRRQEARARLREGRELALQCGATPWVARADEELRASGAHLVRRPATGLAALTPSELRVAMLAREGQGNPEIARSLVLSPKTVEMHLSRVYRKLGVSSRRQLADVMDAADLASD